MPSISSRDRTNASTGSSKRSFPMLTFTAISAALMVEKKLVWSPRSSSVASSFNLSGADIAQSQQWVSIRNLIQPPSLRIDLVIEVRADPDFADVAAEDPLLPRLLVAHQACDRLPVPRDDDFLAG